MEASDKGPDRNLEALTKLLAMPAVHITLSSEPSRSHFGGSPHLPVGMAWPEYKGKRLDFIARISLEDLQQTHSMEWLPEKGALLFFYGLEEMTWGFEADDRGSAAVLLVPDLADPVANAESAEGEVAHRNIQMRRIASLPSDEHEAIEALGLSEDEYEDYAELIDDIFNDESMHQIGGFPYVIQNDGMEEECELMVNGPRHRNIPTDKRKETMKAASCDWALLLQLESDDDLDLMWGDAGHIYFWIQKKAAKRGDFNNPWLILQCY